MKRNKVIIFAVAATLVLGFSSFLLYSCGGGGGGSGTSSAPIGLYLTDDMSLFTQVTATINKVQVLNSGSGASCDLLTIPTAVNIAELSNVIQLVNVAECPAVPYNRIHIEFEKGVELTSAATGSVPGTTSSCTFVSYKDEADHPNTLACSGTNCTLDINGAVNVLVNRPNKLALDFDLKNFDVVSFGTPSLCSVTMKVSPLHAGEMEATGHPEGFTGLISNLSTTDQTFTLTRGQSSFNVLYSGITTTQQPGLGGLLERAEADGLRVRITSANIDFVTNTVTASSIAVKIEGTVSDLTATTFTLTYQGGKTLSVDYGTAVAVGTLANGASVNVTLYGFDSVNNRYLASKVEVEDGTSIPLVI